MILTGQEIEQRQIVRGTLHAIKRSTTYDATVGEIIIAGRSIHDATYVLPPRGIVWVSSKESFHLPSDVTGLATLRTTWTHQGVLALNLGIIDPGWQNHLATAIVNFSKTDFEVRKGDAFLRVLFLEHKPSVVPQVGASPAAYLDAIRGNTRHFSTTFLTIDSLVNEVAERVLGFPRWAVRIGLLALLFAILAIVIPLAWAAVTQNFVLPSRIDALEKSLAELKAREVPRLGVDR